MAELKVILETEDDTRLEIEAHNLGVTKSGFLRLLLKNWLGEVKLEKKINNNSDIENKQ